LSLGEMKELPQAVALRQFWFGCERGPVDEAAQCEADAVEPLALFEVGHLEQFRVAAGTAWLPLLLSPLPQGTQRLDVAHWLENTNG
jgi:hypothetical protein